MLNFFNDTTKIKFFSQIQNDLCSLPSNSKDEQINEIIEKFPNNILNNKDDLMMICQLFAYNSRAVSNGNKRNSIKLFEKILFPIKTHLKNESSFFWQIFKGLFCFKLWTHEEGLISIEQIIRETRKDTTGNVALYFLPEIIEKEPEIYSKEIKFLLKKDFSEEYITEFKELRQKYFKWLIESNDFMDPSYLAIEKDPLRLSIKRDDVDGFQKIISKSNLSINSKICESLIESTSFFYEFEFSLIDFAIQYGAIRIFKYLIMNDANVCESTIFSSILLSNYEIIHLIEEIKKEEFSENSLKFSICLWKLELIEYSITNYDHSYLEKTEISEEYDHKILYLFEQSFKSINFLFFESNLIQFFQNNREFIKRNIYRIVRYSLYDYSGQMLCECLKYPGINVNYYSEGENSFLSEAISIHNTRAVEILMNSPNIDVYNSGNDKYLPFQLACSKNCDLKIVKLFCDFPNYDINEYGSEYRMPPFLMSVINGNTYTTEYLIYRYQDLRKNVSFKMIQLCFKRKKYITAKLLLDIYLSDHKDRDINEFLNTIPKEELDIFYQIYDEVKPND